MNYDPHLNDNITSSQLLIILKISFYNGIGYYLTNKMARNKIKLYIADSK